MKSLTLNLAAVLLGLTPLMQTQASPPEKPNIIVIMCDDAGYADFGYSGGEIPTPNLDRLAREGVVMTQFYNEGRCMPTRLALMSGLNAESAHLNQAGEVESSYGIGDACVTIPEVLGTVGYATYMIGKWHLGDGISPASPTISQAPFSRGFQRFYGIWEGASEPNKAKMKAKWERGNKGPRLVENDAEVPWEQIPDDYYNTHSWNRKAIEYIKATPADQPFFLYAAHTAPHWPLDPLPESLKRAEGIYKDGWDAARARIFERQKQMGFFPESAQLGHLSPHIPPFDPNQRNHAAFSEKSRDYFASIIELDDAIGELMAALKETGRDKNTLVLFFSDNGAETLLAKDFDPNRPPAPDSTATARTAISNTPYYGSKLTMYEGGTATPMVAWWPGRIPAGKLNVRQVGHVKDIMATCIELSGATYPETYEDRKIQPIQGKSILPALTDPSFAESREYGWMHEVQLGYRKGDWKIVKNTFHQINGPSQRPASLFYARPEFPMEQWLLFDLSKDPTERENLASQYPERVAELSAAFDEWAKVTRAADRMEKIMNAKPEADPKSRKGRKVGANSEAPDER